MNLKPVDVDKLNVMLASPKLDIPSFKREVHYSGSNYVWLQKNIGKRNPSLPEELKTLLCIK